MEEPKYSSERERSVRMAFYPSQIAHVIEPGTPQWRSASNRLSHGAFTYWSHLVGVKICVGYCSDVSSYGSML
jgi:hypothetical protein